MVRAVLLLLTLLLAMGFIAPIAESARWGKPVVVVYDYSGPEWSPLVREAVDSFNANLPKRAPRLEYRSFSGPCGKSVKGGITICVAPRAEIITGALAESFGKQKHGAMISSVIRFSDHATPELHVACHELFHSMGVYSHGAWTEIRPCPYDASLMRKKYQRKHR